MQIITQGHYNTKCNADYNATELQDTLQRRLQSNTITTHNSTQTTMQYQYNIQRTADYNKRPPKHTTQCRLQGNNISKYNTLPSTTESNSERKALILDRHTSGWEFVLFRLHPQRKVLILDSHTSYVEWISFQSYHWRKPLILDKRSAGSGWVRSQWNPWWVMRHHMISILFMYLRETFVCIIYIIQEAAGLRRAWRGGFLEAPAPESIGSGQPWFPLRIGSFSIGFLKTSIDSWQAGFRHRIC